MRDWPNSPATGPVLTEYYFITHVYYSLLSRTDASIVWYPFDFFER